MICMSVELMDQQGCREWSGLRGGGAAGGSLEKSGGPVADGQVSREQNWNWEDREDLVVSTVLRQAIT